MIGNNNWEHDLEKIKTIESQDKKIKFLIESFLSTFSLEEALLFRYSPIDHLAEGIFSATTSEFKRITSIRDDVTTIPAIFEAIQTQSSQYLRRQLFPFKYLKKIYYL